MFQRKELAQLRREKEQLLFQSDAHRLQLMSDWQRLQSPGLWLDETLGLTRRHPMWIAGLATVAGALAFNTLREPRTLMAGIGRLGELASAAFAVWRLLRRKWRQS
ncbi:MAG TPA: hypothetical protein VKS19_05140 [Verrucomicrobiae bacterium]|nr:hypothetical protein [Verrucomicrobiae bacterium]